MDKIKRSHLFRTISLILIFTFISLDISYAYPPEHNAPNQNLAVWSSFQQKFEKSIFSEGALLASVCDIGKYFFNDTKDASSYAGEAVEAKFGKSLSESGITILNMVPVEYLRQTEPAKLKDALDKIGFKGTLPNERVIFILCEKGGRKFLIQIAKKGEVSPANLPGYE